MIPGIVARAFDEEYHTLEERGEEGGGGCAALKRAEGTTVNGSPEGGEEVCEWG